MLGTKRRHINVVKTKGNHIYEDICACIRYNNKHIYVIYYLTIVFEIVTQTFHWNCFFLMVNYMIHVATFCGKLNVLIYISSSNLHSCFLMRMYL